MYYAKQFSGKWEIRPIGKMEIGTAFAKGTSNEVLANYDIYPVKKYVVTDDTVVEERDPPVLIDGEVHFYSEREKTNDEYWSEIRENRNQLLLDTDWTDLPNSPLTDSQKTNYQRYRNELRDVPQSTANPKDVVWPEL
jgi:hypothetical protein